MTKAIRFGYGPELCALAAALLNGTIGVFTRIGLEQGATPESIAFWKCFVAFLLVLSYCTARRELRAQTLKLAPRWSRFACLSFLGIFCLYYFETRAFAHASIPLVSFLTYAAGGLTIALSSVCLKEAVTRRKIVAFLAIVVGVGVITLFEGGITGNAQGIVLALLGGCGYALFIFLSKGFRIGYGLPQLVWLFGFGSVFLSMTMAQEGIVIPSARAWTAIVALVLLPTIGGFYFTTRAVAGGQAGKVQIIETSDPLFATLFGFAIFSESLGVAGIAGAGCIMAGLLIAIRPQ